MDLPAPTKQTPFPIVTGSQKAVLSIAIVFIILPITAVILRIIARRLAMRALDISDYFIITACVFSVALESISISGVFLGGIGYDHVTNIIVAYGMQPITTLLKLIIPLQFMWALSLSFCKVSILFLYAQVFAVPYVIWTARIGAGFIAVWAVATILTGCFICRPFAFNWDQTIPGGHCGNQVTSFTVTGVLNLLTDVVVLGLPLPCLYKLQMRLYKKIVLIAVFSVGLLTCVVSAIRIHTLASINFADITISLSLANIFSGLEPAVAVTLACIPLLRPLLGRGKYSKNGTANYASMGDSKIPDRRLEVPEQLGDDSSQYRLRPMSAKHGVEISVSRKTGSSVGGNSGNSDMEGDENNGITVRNEWAVSEERKPGGARRMY